MLNKLFNYHAENNITFNLFKEDKIYTVNYEGYSELKKVSFVLERGFITNIYIFVEQLKVKDFVNEINLF